MDGINLKNVSHVYQRQLILSDVDLHVQKEKITCLVGPNGAGKSTILKLFAGLLVPLRGHITLDNIDIRNFTRRALAKKLSYMPQQCRIPAGLTVREYVALGRFCHQSWFSNLKEDDHAAIEQAIDMADLSRHADQFAATLSTGEQQRARIALMLAQQSEYLLLDEPMTGLDLKQQRNLLELLTALRKHHAKTIIVILHDLHQVIAMADEAVMLKEGRVLDRGQPRTVINPHNLCSMFDYPFDLFAQQYTQTGNS
jgi:iron complex transport system ATP-binding protein